MHEESCQQCAGLHTLLRRAKIETQKEIKGYWRKLSSFTSCPVNGQAVKALTRILKTETFLEDVLTL